MNKYGVDTNDVGIIGDGGILLVYPATDLGKQAVNAVVVYRPTTDTFWRDRTGSGRSHASGVGKSHPGRRQRQDRHIG